MSYQTPPGTFACVMLTDPTSLPDWLDPEATTMGDEAIAALTQAKVDDGGVLAIKIGDEIFIATDMGEPEDATFARDWGWVPQVIRNAYKQGVADEMAREAEVRRLCEGVAVGVHTRHHRRVSGGRF